MMRWIFKISLLMTFIGCASIEKPYFNHYKTDVNNNIKSYGKLKEGNKGWYFADICFSFYGSGFNVPQEGSCKSMLGENDKWYNLRTMRSRLYENPPQNRDIFGYKEVYSYVNERIKEAESKLNKKIIFERGQKLYDKARRIKKDEDRKNELKKLQRNKNIDDYIKGLKYIDFKLSQDRFINKSTPSKRIKNPIILEINKNCYAKGIAIYDTKMIALFITADQVYCNNKIVHQKLGAMSIFKMKKDNYSLIKIDKGTVSLMTSVKSYEFIEKIKREYK